jgi:tetratricopeptide (TPR) repeat protein
VWYELGRFDESYEAAEEAEALTGPWDLSTLLPAKAARAKVLARRGAFDEAQELIAAAERTIRATELFQETADLLMAKAEVLRLAGRTTEAAASATEALEMYEMKEYVPLIAKARAFLEQLPDRVDP